MFSTGKKKGKAFRLDIKPLFILRVNISIPPTLAKKSTSFRLSIFLSKPQAWYIITQSVYIIAEGVYHHAKHESSCGLMIYKACALMIYNSFGIDDIHGFAVIKMRKCAPKRLCFRLGRRKAKPFDSILNRFSYYESRYLFRPHLPKNNRNSDTKGLRFFVFCDIIFLERRKHILSRYGC